MAPFSFFKKLGIPGPAPWPFVGNVPEMSKKVKHVKLCYLMLKKEENDIYISYWML